MANWCVNFDGDAGPAGDQPREYVLRHGLPEQLWLMQYQYSHGGHIYQGHPDQIVQTTINWRWVLPCIRLGDWLVAYLKRNRFFAVGQVIEPSPRGRYKDQPRHEDTVARTTDDHTHLHLNGFVRYTDTPAAYEDFTDPWNLPLVNSYSQREVWRYNQRIDVREWQHRVDEGVVVPGVLADVGPAYIQCAAFEIKDDSFITIRAALQKAAGE